MSITSKQTELAYLKGYHDAQETYINGLRKGYWLRVGWANKSNKFKCSNCNNIVYFIDGTARKDNHKSECRYHFCPWCLSDMRIRVYDTKTENTEGAKNNE